jgi:bifunctional DNA-binding transcriptional regulator/antitoxin component of YhaV-PrlF toxin-antitoxin module
MTGKASLSTNHLTRKDSRIFQLKVGTNGEIYTTDKVRRAVGIEPRSVVLAEVGEKQLILRPKQRAKELLDKPRFSVPPVSGKQMSKLRRKLATQLAQR